ncbi:MAG: barstar family protein [Flavobacterium sp.]
MKKKDIKNATFLNAEVCSTKEELFTLFSEKLNFPDYFSGNWDSFEEIINDLPLNSDVIILYNIDSLLPDQPEEKSILLDIIHTANQNQKYQFYTLNKL